jgi:hypothetical protein
VESFLIEITAEVLQRTDAKTGGPLVDVILDEAEQKGTGRCTAIYALELGALGHQRQDGAGTGRRSNGHEASPLPPRRGPGKPDRPCLDHQRFALPRTPRA